MLTVTLLIGENCFLLKKMRFYAKTTKMKLGVQLK